MYNVNGFLNLGLRRGRRQMLDLRAPEDRLSDDEPSRGVRRSPAVGNWIDAYRTADDDDDDDGRATALRGIIDANRADMASAGLPVFAHPALPEEFADELARGSSGVSIASVLKQFDPSVRQGVAQQLLGPAGSDPSSHVAAGGGRFALLGGDEDDGAPPPPAQARKPPPRANPAQPDRQREAERQQKCADLRRYILLGRDYRKRLEAEKADLERQISSSRQSVPRMEKRRDALRLHLRDLQDQLAKFQRGAAVGGDGTPIECPPDLDPKPRQQSPWPNRKRRQQRRQTREATRDAICDALAEGVESGYEKRRRDQSIAALQNEIRQVEAELRNLDAQIAGAGQPRPEIQARINQIESDIYYSLSADKEDREDYKRLGCDPAGIAY